MLSRYDGKTIRLTTNDGEVFTGEAEAFPSGCGLDTFGMEEESVCINSTHIFLSQIARIEPPDGFAVTDAERERYDALTRDLIDRPYRTVDMLPTPVPEDAAGQVFMVNRFFRLAPQRSVLRRRQARILLRLNCYDDMAVTTDGGTNWEKNPDPERFVRTLDELSDGFVRALFPTLNVMVELYGTETQMTVVCPDAAPTETIRQLAAAEGLFLWEEKE